MSSKGEIIEQLTRIVEQNLGNDQFGVTELAEAYAVSRSTLLRLVKKHTGLSVNQFIKEIRLEQAHVMLNETEKTSAEISYETGFSSPSYFIKCYKEKYGFSPGEIRQGAVPEMEKTDPKRKPPVKVVVGVVISILLILTISYLSNDKDNEVSYEGKSIAVLPFKNESADSSNVYFVNGMMESILNNLQKIEELRVISRTSVEKYRNMNFSSPEIAVDLGVDYILEGSGQKSGDNILLTVQLIEAMEDRHLWSNQYNRKLADVFKLQAEVSKTIAAEIEVVINPAVEEQFELAPTDNIEAYDAFLKGMEFIQLQLDSNLDSAIKYYEEAIALDEQFANPYAYMAVCYYYKDVFKVEKEHLEDLDAYADKALLLNGTLPEALIARGLYYMQTGRYSDAREYFEKVLEYNPNSAWTHNFLSEIYHLYLPNTEKYLIHALSALQLDLSASDSMDVSNTHLILSNAFCQSGMMDKAKKHIQISLDYDSTNAFSGYLSIYIDMVGGLPLEQAIERMHKIYEVNPTRLDVVKELASMYYLNEDYENSFTYFSEFAESKKSFGLNIFPDEDITIAIVCRAVGQDTMAQTYRNAFDTFIESTENVYKPFLQTLAFLYDGEPQKAMDAYEEFSKAEDYMYWILLAKDDPLFNEIRDNPRFVSIQQSMEADFESRKERRIQTLKELGLWQ